MNKEFVLTLYSHRITKDFLMQLAEILWQNIGEEKVILRITDRYGELHKMLEVKSMKVNPNLEMYLEIINLLQNYRYYD
tara:strand:+ start:363 stop:599 length:237 start_codon:yes stop_codon:yes gene_type:complete